jgi:phosphatidylglycerol:prolipoprotein diacylglycerol transferase
LTGIPFPDFDPVALQLGPIAIRWYALAYIAGLFGGLLYAKRLAANDVFWDHRAHRPSAVDLDDLLLWATLGVIAGGRLAYVLFYQPAYYAAKPIEAFAIWSGGMSFHGGLAGATLAMYLFARVRKLRFLPLADIIATVAPLGLFLGRLTNFVNGELWGRVTAMPWGFVFPTGGPLPRHPSQLYEAATEGLLLLVALFVAARAGAYRRPGLVTGLFGAGYAIARIGCEFFREPDPQLGFLVGGFATMGMLLSLPMLALGLWLILRARSRPAAA